MLTKIQAYKKLGIIGRNGTSKDATDKLHAMPQVTPMLKEIMSGLKERNLPVDPYYYLNSSADLSAQALMQLYRATAPTARALLTLEAFCLAASVDPNAILEAIVNSITRMNALKAGISLSVSQSEIVNTNIEAAKDIYNGYKDRYLHMKVSGMMPMPKGAKTIVNVHSNANASSAPVNQSIIMPAPPPEQTVRRLSERLHAIKGTLPLANQQVEDAVIVEEE
jgi:hypothetical protein